MTLHLIVLSFHILCNCGLVQFLVGMWIFCIHVDLIISEYNAFRRIFVENDVEWDLLSFCDCKEVMFLHLFPAKSGLRIILHCLVEEIEAL